MVYLKYKKKYYNFKIKTNRMKKIIKKISLLILFAQTNTATWAQERFSLNTAHIVRNKGQIKNEKGEVRHDVDFVLNNPTVQVLIGAGKLEYRMVENGGIKQISMRLQHCLPKPQLIAESKNQYSENYYLNGEAIEAVQAADRICYKNIYQGIDWVVYLNNGKLEHEFVLAKNANAQQIQWTYTGTDKNLIDAEGNIVVQNGNIKITEKAPQSFTNSGKTLNSHYLLSNNLYSYQLHTTKESYTIDPSVEWATYQSGNNGFTRAIAATNDKRGNLYIAGVTSATTGLATAAGVHQSTNAGDVDVYISKFDTSGKHIWTTYYGGAKADVLYDIQYQNGKLYFVGATSSNTGIATSGTQQPVLGVYPSVITNNAMLVKMDTNGKRIWGTYCGEGKRGTTFYAVGIDSKENVYCTGTTADSNMIASAGSFKDTFAYVKGTFTSPTDALLIKYDSSGKRLWGTYIGDTGTDYAQTITIYNDIIYIGGNTNSQRGIATASSYKPSFVPFNTSDLDMLLMRFDTTGKRLWGTYYGGKGAESAPLITCSKNGNIYIYGFVVDGDTALASAGAFQSTAPGGTTDLFLAKFDTTCKRIWSTYVSTPLYDENGTGNGKGSVEETSDDGNIWITGQTRGTGKGLATADAYKDSLNPSGKRDAFIGCISPLGEPIYYSYYGGEADDRGFRTFVDGQTAYLVGSTFSATGIATAGSHKSTNSSVSEAGYIVKFAPSKPSGINTVKQQAIDLNIYPNPARNFVSITGAIGSEGKNEVAIEVLNVVGKTVQNEKAFSLAGKIDHKLVFFESLQAGLYFIKVHVNNQTFTEKVIKE